MVPALFGRNTGIGCRVAEVRWRINAAQFLANRSISLKVNWRACSTTATLSAHLSAAPFSKYSMMFICMLAGARQLMIRRVF
jgi:hypothetical protein